MLKKITGVAAGSGLAMMVAGCGVVPGLGGPSPIEVVNGLAKKTDEVKSYSATMEIQGESVDMEYTKKPEPTIKMEMDVQGSQSTMLMRGDEMLMDASAMGPAAPGGAEWLRMDQSEEVVDVGAQDPLSEVDKLLAAKEAEEVGTKTVDGEETTKYTGKYSVKKALSEIDDKKQREAAEKTYEDKSIDSIDFDVYVDGDGYPRKVVSKAGGDFESTLTFEEFNQSVDIDYPSEDEITDMDGLSGGPGGVRKRDTPGSY